MIGLVLLYFIGKSYYDLAGQYQKSKWGFAILGIVSYYVGGFLGRILVAIVYEVGMSGSIDDMNYVALSIIALPFGALTCWGLYQILKNQWSKVPAINASEDILDANLIEQRPKDHAAHSSNMT